MEMPCQTRSSEDKTRSTNPTQPRLMEISKYFENLCRGNEDSSALREDGGASSNHRSNFEFMGKLRRQSRLEMDR